MALTTDCMFPNRRAYVVKLHSDAAPGALHGRVENLLTCEQREFASAPELVALLESDLQAPATAHAPKADRSPTVP